jgi:alpha-tubulin suppressor-like RCC1 family protein
MNLFATTFPSLAVFSIFASQDGHFYSCGNNSYSILGDPNRKGEAIGELQRMEIPGVKQTEVASIGCGAYHVILLTTDSRVLVWGRNTEKQLGIIPVGLQRQFSPSILKFPGGEEIVSVHGGAFFSATVTKSGKVFAWGKNDYGQLGSKCSGATPKLVPIPEPVISVSCGWSHAAALTPAGSLYFWGSNRRGQLGHPSFDKERVPPSLHPTFQGVRQVVCGDHHTGVLLKDGTVFFFGALRCDAANYNHDITTPHKFFEPEAGIIGIAAGSGIAMALGKDGTIYAWGNNYYGNIGNGTSHNHISFPEKIILDPENPGARAIFLGTGYYHTFAITQDGSMYTWGQGTEGATGHGCLTDVTTPEKVENFKWCIPKSEKWAPVMYWLFLGRSDENSGFNIFPMEVIFQFCLIDF